MQCVTPMFRQYDFSTGKTIRIVPRAEVTQGLDFDPNMIRYYLDTMNSKYRIRNQKVQTIPCGHCWACQLNYSAEWATRNMLETLEHDHCYFITLTYDDEHLPILEESKIKIKKDLGDHYEFQEITFENDGTWISGSLWPDHVSKFVNSLRKHFEREGITGIKYFYCGEYGTQTLRPHYHMLLYGVPLDLSQNYSYHIDNNFKEHWKNPLIDKYWKYGMHDIANVEWSSAAYVSRYCTKKLFTGRENAWEYAKIGKEPEFIRMSRRPGIGMSYYNLHKNEIYEHDSMVMKTVKGNTGSFKPPKAFDKLFKEEFPEQFEKIENRRKECAERSRRNLYYLSDYTDKERLEMKTESIETKAKMLVREL